MKKIILFGALFNLICTQVQALPAPDTASKKISPKTKSSVVNKTSQRSALTQKNKQKIHLKSNLLS